MHRLVRVSPYDELRRRHTSFAKVVIYPDVSEFDCVAGSSSSSSSSSSVPSLTRDDVRIETFRSSGPGGQHAQKTESAVGAHAALKKCYILHIERGVDGVQVRVTHEGSGCVAVCSSARSQGENLRHVSEYGVWCDV